MQATRRETHRPLVFLRWSAAQPFLEPLRDTKYVKLPGESDAFLAPCLEAERARETLH